MKKILLGISVLFLGVVLVACGGDDTEDYQAYLDAAGVSLNAVISDPDNVTNDITVPSGLGNDVSASWVSSEPGVASVGTANDSGLITISINRPENGVGDASVTLTATLSVTNADDEVVTDEWSIVITVVEKPASTAVTIAEAREMTSGTVVTVEGVVLGQSGNGLVAIQDETDGVGIYDFNYVDELRGLVGHKVQVTGEVSPYSGLFELANVSSLEDLGASTLPTPVDLSTIATWDAENLISTQMQLVTLNNVLVTVVDSYVSTSSGYEAILLTVKDVTLDQELNFRYEDRVSIGDTTFLEAVEEGDYVTFTGAVMSWYNDPQLAITNVDQITAGSKPELSDEEAVTADLGTVNVEDVFYEAGSFADVANITTDNDTTLVWSFKDSEDADNSYVDLTTGAVTLP
ncbi:hypothetical protein KHQ89_01230 [Mycoplasmatota bacterium]|nr:hypothetical protein KHQ89_01230 [Mycoplasmatota bacterium]